jgi:hypothetical protein
MRQKTNGATETHTPKNDLLRRFHRLLQFRPIRVGSSSAVRELFTGFDTRPPFDL